MVDPLSYFSFQPVLSCCYLENVAHVVVAVGFLSRYRTTAKVNNGNVKCVGFEGKAFQHIMSLHPANFSHNKKTKTHITQNI